MKLLSVNVSPPREASYEGRTIRTGIFKAPVAGRVMVRRLNIEGDGQADLKVHGGPDMAVYAYPFAHYGYWERELGRRGLPFGQFGENLTLEGGSEITVRVGDVFRVGGAVLQATQPRIPCYKLALRMGEDSGFPLRFQDSGRMGFYLRVLEEGEVGAGDVLERLETDERAVTIAEFIRIYLHETHRPQSLRRLLASRDLGQAWRAYLEKMLDRARPVVDAHGWAGYRTFVVERKVPESETITSFYLAPEDGEALPPFKPGQFLTFRLEIPAQDRPVTRTYTISDRPHPGYYRLSIKLEPPPARRSDVPPGVASSYFHHLVAPGARLCVKAPTGGFWLDTNEDTPVVLLSGGVGLTPMISMLNAIAAAESRRPVWFIHGARNGREHALGAHVRRLAAEHENIHSYVRYSRPEPGDVEGRDYDGVGHIDRALLERLLPPALYDFYLCGPAPFLKSLYRGLSDWGVSEGRIHYEFFGPAATLRADSRQTRARPADQEPGTAFNVDFARSGVRGTWDADAGSLLEFAEARGLHPDYSCRSGICHSCMCRLIAGEVDYTLDPVDLPDPGCVLICCSRPRGDVVLDI